MKNADEITGLNFISLIYPIFVENFLRMLVLVCSYGLVSRISDDMAAILGITNLYLLVGFSLVECLAQGGCIILTQYLGAKKEEEVGQIYVTTIWLNVLFGLILSIVFAAYSSLLLATFGFAGILLDQGADYLTLVGSGFGVYALNYALLYILNANGLTKYSMAYSLLVNGMSLGLYSLIATLPDSFLMNRLTLIGVTNLFVRFCGMLFLIFMTKAFVRNFYLYKKIPSRIVKEHIFNFLRISLPNAFEPLSYQLFQFVLVKIISTINMESLSLRSYIISLTTLFETASWSISRGNQIYLGYLIGAKRIQWLNPQLKKGIIASVFISILILFFGLPFRHQLIGFFSHNQLIVDIGSPLVILVAILTLIRAFSFNLHAGLKAAGDIKFGLALVMISMWGVTIPSAYIVTHFFHVELQGIWVILIIEELIRVFFLSQRWKSQNWKKFSVVHTPP